MKKISIAMQNINKVMLQSMASTRQVEKAAQDQMYHHHLNGYQRTLLI